LFRNKFSFVVLVLSLVVTCPATWAADTELQVGKAHDSVLVAPKTDMYSVLLKAGDLAEANVVTQGSKFIVSVYRPSGSNVRGFRFNGVDRKIAFVADDPGDYRLEVRLDANTNKGTYTLTLTKITSLEDRVAPPTAERYESPRIQALRNALKSSRANAVEGFWAEVKMKGTPLIEPLPGTDKDMLVTFLWRATVDTRNVSVRWDANGNYVVFNFSRPDDYQLTRLGDTDAWYKSMRVDKRKRFMYQLIVNGPPLRPSQELPDDNTMSLFAAASQADPLNPRLWLVNFSAVEMPNAPPQPWVAPRKDVPKGKIEKYQFKSALLKNEREVAVYSPAGYSRDAKPYGLIVLFDENPYIDKNIVPTPTILDNLVAGNRIPRMVAVFIDNPPGDTRDRELPCNPKFADFLNSELIPWVRRLFNVTNDPQQTIVGGSSYGGLAAAYAGFRHPETFGNVLSQSGAFWWTPPRSDDPEDFDFPNTEPNWLATQFIKSPRLPVRFYMEAGTDEIDLTGLGRDILASSRHMRDVLLAKGYEVHYQEFVGGHDYLSWRGTLADGLIVLTGSTKESHEQGTTAKH
jgi:enterochelin esterase-like enzyme